MFLKSAASDGDDQSGKVSERWDPISRRPRFRGGRTVTGEKEIDIQDANEER